MNNLKIISQNPDHYQLPQKNGGNEDPLRHTVENTRAMDAAKLERVLAKPFIACFDGHNKGVWNIIKAYFTAITFIIWYKRWSTHNLNGICVDASAGEIFTTIGQGSQLKHWNLPEEVDGDLSDPSHSIPVQFIPHSILHLPVEASIMASCASGRSVFLLDTQQKAPLMKIVMSLRTFMESKRSFYIYSASDVYNVYIVDMRNLKSD
uniref:Uncharacterized protein n=1 Tax=Panagrolaimus sp. PS1159 TaxID=55785 RepID=A0AC35GC01_9BILA